MTQETREFQEHQESNGHGKAVFAGVLLGGLTGALTALLFAPQSGKETRDQIQNKVSTVRDGARDKVDQGVEQLRLKAGNIKAEVGTKAREVRQRGADVLVEQLDRVSAAAEAGKKSIQGGRS